MHSRLCPQYDYASHHAQSYGLGLNCHTAQAWPALAWPGLSGNGSSSVRGRAHANANGKMLKQGPGQERTGRN